MTALSPDASRRAADGTPLGAGGRPGPMTRPRETSAETTPATPPLASTAARLAALRAVLPDLGADGLVVPHADAHQCEFIPANAERLAWLTGFTGSAGTAVVLPDRAAMFTDGRYTVQVAREVDADLFSCHHAITDPPSAWLARTLAAGTRLGFDPWLHTPHERRQMEAACTTAGAHLVALTVNPIDRLWTDRPPPPRAPVHPHPLIHAGRSAAEKVADIAATLRSAGQDVAVLSAPDSIAWLLNIRGGDVAHTPLPLAYALLFADERVDLFLDPAKETPDLRAHLGPHVTLTAPDGLGPALDALGRTAPVVRIDPQSTPVWIADRLTDAGATLAEAADPCQAPKARKTEAEVAGARAAHVRDGRAVIRFLHWLDETAPAGGVTECSAAARLEAFRRDLPLLQDLSFPTISAAGANAALCHYRATPQSDSPLTPGSLYLVDSGGQYPDGTTDITRTVAIGQPDDEMRRCFTLVLKGHIALARARFPQGTSGQRLDALARAPLWAGGLDYDHGTGHGVGSYLGVHEGPARISPQGGSVALEPGMILSIEPGYYRAGAFGLRIENLVVVQPDTSDPAPADPGRAFLCFETLTLVPIDRRLIDADLLEPSEQAWLDAYHARVHQTHAGHLPPDAARWLETATRPLAEGGA